MSKTISLRVSPEQMEVLQENATRHGSSSVSEYVRDVSVNFKPYLLQLYSQGITDVKNGRVKI